MAGLTTLTSPDARYVLYAAGDNSLDLRILDLKTNKTEKLGFKTYPNKCVWSKKAPRLYCAVPASLQITNEIESWFRGEINTSDDIWQINVDKGDNYVLFNSKAANIKQNLDVQNIIANTEENNLYFINKLDNSLWSLDISKNL